MNNKEMLIEIKVLKQTRDAPETTVNNDKGNENAAPKISPKQLFRYASGTDIILMLLGSIAACIHGASMPFMTIFFGDIITAIVLYQPTDAGKIAVDASVSDGAIKMCIVGVVALVCAYFQMSFWMLAGENQAKRIRESYFKAIIRQDIGWFDTMTTGDLTTRLTADLNVIQEGISDKVGLFIQFTSTFLTGFIIAYVRGWQLALVLTGTLPLLAGVAVIMGKVLRGGSIAEQQAYAEAGSIAQQVFSSIKTVVAFGGENKEIARYCEKLDDAEKIGIKKSLQDGAGLGSIQFVIFGVYALAFWYGSSLVPTVMQSGTVLNVIFAIIIGAFSLGNAAPNISSIGAALGSATIIYDTIEKKSPIDPLSDEGIKPILVKGLFEFKNIDFHYPTRADVPVLTDFNLVVKPGTTVALVGSSGSGKSTAIKLIERFYDPVKGSVFLDGVDLKTINVTWLRQQIGIVSQEPCLFDTTIKENILFGLDNFETLSDVEAMKKLEIACRQANCWDFIQLLPLKFLTKVGEAGTMLSGGQKQRIAIARAIIKNPPILLLDEATSALDTESERVVQTALDNASKNRTTLVVAHRLSTIKKADMIIAMSKGKIVEKGTHDELVSKKGMYAELVNSQTLKVREGEQLAAEEQKEQNAPEVKQLTLNKNGPVSSSQKPSDEQAELKIKAAKVKVDYRRLLRMNKPEYGWFVVGAIGSMLNGASQPLFSILFSNMLTILGTPSANDYALLFLALGVGAFLSNFAEAACFKCSSVKMTRRVREQCFRALVKQEMAYYDEDSNSTGNITTKLAEDASLIPGLTGPTIGAIFQGVTGIVVGLVIALKASWQLALLVLLMVPLISGAGVLQMKTLLETGKKTRKAYEITSQKANETIQNIRTIATITQEKYFYETFAQSILFPHQMTVKGAYLSSFGFAFSQSVLHFTWALSLYYGAQLLKMGLYKPSDILNAMFAIIFTAMSAGRMTNQIPDAAKGKLAAAAVFELLDRKSRVDVTLGIGEQRPFSEGRVKLENVEFTYPSRPDIKILKGLDIMAEPGKTIALVGKSGCGKSTVMGLMLRWYESTSGEVTYDGLKIESWNLISLRSFMAIVGQEPVLFNISIRDNIAYGALSPPNELQIHEAAKSANIHDFVMSLPKGYDESVGEKGGQMSGGQKQRIAIARSLIRNPKLLLLDESTSALDSESEAVVQKALDAAAKGRTTLVIAHRLSTIQDADMILVVDQGRIVESGTHFELLDLKGRYADLVNQQSLH